MDGVLILLESDLTMTKIGSNMFTNLILAFFYEFPIDDTNERITSQCSRSPHQNRLARTELEIAISF